MPQSYKNGGDILLGKFVNTRQRAAHKLQTLLNKLDFDHNMHGRGPVECQL